MLSLQFLGAAETVTGSKYLLQTENKKFLVDCGLFQGLKNLREKNWQSFDIDPASIDAIFLTHAHIDHSGFIPRLYAQGFNGNVYCSQGTYELCKILLPDSGYLQEEEANYRNKKGYSRHHPALPLYTKDQAIDCLNLFKPFDFDEEIYVKPNIKCKFIPAGHILGASCVYLEIANRKIIFSGDVGRFNDLIMRPPKPLPDADYLVIESTYGDRLHEDEEIFDKIATIVNRSIKRGGTIVIPAFAVGRAQHMLYIFHTLLQQKKIPKVKIFLDSPMSIDATQLYCKFHDEHKLTDEECKSICQNAIFSHTQEDSKKINDDKSPKIIISASGMASGGRILHHLLHYLPDAKNTIIFVGFQAAGTRGRILTENAKTVTIFGNECQVNAEVINFSGLSAHGDYEDLLKWLKNSPLKRPKVFITHGEKSSSQAFKEKIEKELNWRCTIPSQGMIANL